MFCHFPPGTSKWNKIEHRLFSFITQNWRAKPLISHEVIVNLIANTTTKKGLKVSCDLYNKYPKGIKISDEKLAESLSIHNIFQIFFLPFLRAWGLFSLIVYLVSELYPYTETIITFRVN
jgi:hypothetical protein